MTKGLLIFSLIVLLLLMICPIIVTLVASKNEKNKKAFKNIIAGVLIIDLIVLILLLSSWVTTIKSKDFSFKNNSITTKSNTSSSTELSEAGFNEITIEEYLDLIRSDEKSIILVARPTCYYCQQFTPILKTAMEDMKLTINYIDTDKFGTEDYKKFNNSLDYLQTDEWGTPLTMIVQNGEILDKNNGYVELDKIKEFFTKNGYGE